MRQFLFLSFYFINFCFGCDVNTILNHIQQNGGCLISGDSQKRINEIYEKSDEIYRQEIKGKYTTSSINECLNTFCEIKTPFTKMCSYIALIREVSLNVTGMDPRSTQLVPLICCADPELLPNYRGLLLQIKTGEGKSLITAMVAAYIALQGDYVDVVSSSGVLAERDCIKYKSFYSALGLVSGFIPESNGEKVRTYRDCNIVYGDMSTLQGDYLRHGYQGLGIRAGRKFGTIILDEVDSILCDKVLYITQLTAASPSLSNLLPLLSHMWFLWNNYNNGGLAGRELDQQVTESIYALMQEEVKFASHNEATQEAEAQERKVIELPKYLKKYVKLQIPRWLKSLRVAMNMEEERDYVIKEGSIIPIDASYTGVAEINMVWGEGVHQFLQLKHFSSLLPEAFTSSYISTRRYLQLYKRNIEGVDVPTIFGLTGTLGDIETKNFFTAEYKLGYCVIPQNKGNPPTNEGTVAFQPNEWSSAILRRIKEAICSARSILVISATIEDAKFLKVEAQADQALCNVKKILYTRSDDKKHLKSTEDPLLAGSIIFATNLAGRGTDIKIPQTMEDGLHVIITFMPRNQRIEEQAFGRAARDGAKGSGQIIINQAQFTKEYGLPFIDKELAIKLRDLRESDRLALLRSEDLLRIDIFDNLFARVCNSYVKIRDCGWNRIVMSQLDELWGLQNWRLHSYEDSLMSDYMNLVSQNIVMTGEPFNGQDALYHATIDFLSKEGNPYQGNIRDLRSEVYKRLWAKESIEEFSNKYGRSDRSPFDADEKEATRSIVDALSNFLERSVVIWDGEESYISKRNGTPIYLFLVDYRMIPAIEYKDLCVLYDIGWDNISSISHYSSKKVIFKYLPVHYVAIKSNKNIPYLKKYAKTFVSSELSDDDIEQVERSLLSLDINKHELIWEERKKTLGNIVDLFLRRIKHEFYVDGIEGQSRAGILDIPVFFVNDGYLCQYALFKEQINGVLTNSRIEDTFLQFAALYTRAMLHVMKDCTGDSTHKEGALNDLKKTVHIVDDFINPWITILILAQKSNFDPEQSTALYLQTQGRIGFVQLLRDNIQKNIAVLGSTNAQKGHFVLLPGCRVENYIIQSKRDNLNGIEGLDSSMCDYWHSICLGNIYGIEFIPPRPPILHSIGVGLLGALQVGIGVLLATTVGGAFWAKDFLIQGIGDLWHSVKSGFCGQAIDWGTYWISKGINYAMAVISSSASKVINYFKSANIAQTVVATGVQQATEQTVTSVIKSSVKSFFVGQAISEISRVISSGLISSFQDDIKNCVERKIRDSVCNNEGASAAFSRQIVVSKMGGCMDHEVGLISFTIDWVKGNKESIWTKPLTNLVNDVVNSANVDVALTLKAFLGVRDIRTTLTFLDQYIESLSQELSKNIISLFELFWQRYECYSAEPVAPKERINSWFTKIFVKKMLISPKEYYLMSSWKIGVSQGESTKESLYNKVSEKLYPSIKELKYVSAKQCKEIHSTMSGIVYELFNYEYYCADTLNRYVHSQLVQVVMGELSGKIQGLAQSSVNTGLHRVYRGLESSLRTSLAQKKSETIEEESSKNKDGATSKQSLADKNLQSSEEEIGNSNDSKNTEGQEPKHSLFNKDSEPPEKEKVDSKGSLSENKDTLSSLVRERNKSIRLRKKGSLFYKYPQNSLNSMIEASNQGSRPNHELRSGSPPPQLLNRSHEIGECTINPSLLIKPSPCEERSMDNKGEWFNPSRISDIVAPSIQSGAIDGTIDGLKSIPSARKVGRVVSFIEGNGTKGMTTTAAIVAKEAFKGGVMSAVTSAVVESVVGETGAIGNIVKSGGSAAISAAVITGGNPVAVGVAAGSSMAITTVIEHTKQELAADKSFVEALSNSNMSNKQISEHLTTAEEISGYREAMTKKSEEESKSKKSQ